MLPCQKIHYVHHLLGGPADGCRVPSEHWYESLEIDGTTYVRDGAPEPVEVHDITVITSGDAYEEAVWLKAKMKPRE